MIPPALVLRLLLALGTGAPPARLAPIAAAIAAVARDRHEAAALVAIELEETSLGRGGPPFGLMRAARCADGAPLACWAGTALRIWRAGRRAGGGDLGAYFYYNSGRPPGRVRGHSPAYRRIGRRALAYAQRCVRAATRAEGADAGARPGPSRRLADGRAW